MAGSDIQPSGQTAASQQPQNTSGKEPPVPPVNPPLRSEASPSPLQKKEAHTCRPDSTPGWKILLEVIALAAVIAYTNAAYQQLSVMSSQLGEMIKQYPEIQKSAEAAKSASETAHGSLLQSIDAFRMDERAWIVIDDIDKTVYAAQPGFFPESYKYKMWPKNVGRTVARNVRILVTNPLDSGGLRENKHGILMEQDQLFHENGNPRKRSIIPDQPGPQNLAPGERSSVPIYAGGTAPYNGGTNYVLGRIDYADVFGANHWTHFCFVVTGGGDLHHCQYGNDDDTNAEPKAK